MFVDLLARIARALDDARIDYMVIGGQAVLIHGEPRLTRDIDVTLGASLDRLDEVVQVVRRIGLEPLVDPKTFAPDTMVVPCSDPRTEIRVDVVLADSPYEIEAMQRTVSVEMAGHPVRFASPEDLVIHKVIAGRARDLDDARSVVLRHPALDRELVRRWLADYGELLDEPLLERFEALDR